MYELPNVASLGSLIAVSSSLHSAFAADERLISSQGLKNEIDAQILPEAFIALESSMVGKWTAQVIEGFTDRYLQERPQAKEPGPTPRQYQ